MHAPHIIRTLGDASRSTSRTSARRAWSSRRSSIGPKSASPRIARCWPWCRRPAASGCWTTSTS